MAPRAWPASTGRGRRYWWGSVRDPLGAVERLTIGERSIAFTRDALGRELRREAGAFALDQRYDTAGQLVGQRAGARNPAGPLEAVAGRLYAYDGAFAPTSVQDTIWGSKSYFYDAGGQLTDAARDGGHEVFAYDEARNLVGAASYAPGAAPRRDTGVAGYGASADGFADWRSSPGGVVQIARGPSGEKLQLTHDACGRLVERRVERAGFRPKRWTYEWNAEGRLVACDGPDGARVIFRYDPFGRRVAKVRRLVVADGRNVPADTDVGTAYLWDGDHMIAEAPLRLSGAIDWGSSTRWHFEDDSHRLLAREGPEGELWPVVCDALGSPQEMFDERGALVWAADRHAWGAVRAVRAAPSTRGALALADAQPFAPERNPGLSPERDPLAARFLCPWRFPGQYEDAETGLFYNRHRHYDPLTGQYASPDPIGLAGGDRPQGYVANPTAWTDPLGLSSILNLNPSDIRLSQSSVSPGVVGHAERMRQTRSFGDPVDVVRMGDGRLTSIDNRRIIAAQRENIIVRARVHNRSDPLTARKLRDLPGRVETKFRFPRIGAKRWISVSAIRMDCGGGHTLKEVRLQDQENE